MEGEGKNKKTHAAHGRGRERDDKIGKCKWEYPQAWSEKSNFFPPSTLPLDIGLGEIHTRMYLARLTLYTAIRTAVVGVRGVPDELGVKARTDDDDWPWESV